MFESKAPRLGQYEKYALKFEAQPIQKGKILFYGSSGFTRWCPEDGNRPLEEDIRMKDGSLAAVNHGFGGATMEETRTKKDEVIQYVLEENSLKPEECMMVGDRSYDIDGAHQCGLKAIGVLYGYGDAEELSGAEFLAKQPIDLLK